MNRGDSDDKNINIKGRRTRRIKEVEEKKMVRNRRRRKKRRRRKRRNFV
jgi:hypothetical protein